MKQQRSPASRQLFIDDSVLQNEEAKPPIRKELLKGDTACGGGGDSDKENVAGDGMLYCWLDMLYITVLN